MSNNVEWASTIKTYRVPLPPRHLRNLNKQPLTSGVLEAWLDNPQLHRTARVDKNLLQVCRPPCPDLAPNTLAEVGDTDPDEKPPAFVSKTMLGGVEREGLDVVRIGRVTNEAARRMRVESNHEEECEVMSVPECLKALVANFPVRRGVHQHDDEKHEMTSDASSLRIVDLQSDFLSDF